MTDDPRRRPARLVDVAEAAGVSVATVSNVLNRPGKVGPETTERIRNAMRRLDYVPHDAAVRLRRGRSRTIGLVLPDVTNPFYAQLARGAADAAYDHRYTLILCDSADDAEREDGYLAMLAEQRVEGAVVAPLSADVHRLDRLRRRGVQLTVVDRLQPTDAGCSVAVDDVCGGRLAVEHLLSLGHRDLVVVNGPAAIPQCADRWHGALQAATGHEGVRLRHVMVGPTMTSGHGYDVGVEVATAADRPTAVFATNDLLALGVMQALTAHQVRVPDDVSIVGYGDLAVAPYAMVPLTTVAQPVHEMGRAAVSLTMAEIDAVEGHRHVVEVMAPWLVERASTAAPGPRHARG